MGSTKKAITQRFINNSLTPTTIAETVESEIVSKVTTISGVAVQSEVAINKEINPGVVGGQAHSN